MITTFEELGEFIADRVNRAAFRADINENDRCRLIADAAIETALFALACTPTTMAHQVMVSGLIVEKLRGFNSPFFVIAREMGTPEELHKELDEFLKRTEKVMH